MKNKIIILSIIFVIFICILSVFVINKNNLNSINSEEQEDLYETHMASTHTERVGGLIPYNVRSDLIIDIPEEYFLDINDSDMTYDELVSEIGEPSGMVGSGIVRDYWRIDEDKYAVCIAMGSNLYFEIWNGQE